jgi:hypothetical protein
MLLLFVFWRNEMSNLLKGLQSLTATRTGVPVSYDYEDADREESRRGTWLILLAVAVAFAVVLQMDAESIQSNAKKGVAGRVSSNLWESS